MCILESCISSLLTVELIRGVFESFINVLFNWIAQSQFNYNVLFHKGLLPSEQNLLWCSGMTTTQTQKSLLIISQVRVSTTSPNIRTSDRQQKHTENNIASFKAKQIRQNYNYEKWVRTMRWIIIQLPKLKITGRLRTERRWGHKKRREKRGFLRMPPARRIERGDRYAPNDEALLKSGR